MSDQDKKDKANPNQPEDNVIRFPVEKVRHKNRLKRLAGKVGDNKKSTLFLSLLSVLVVSVYLLRDLQENNRYIASSIDNRDLQKEAVLNETLQDENRRIPASYGRAPTAEELLREQELNRGYQFNYSPKDGKVVEVQYVPSDENTEMFEPVFLKKEEIPNFLLRYREAISPGFDQVEDDGESYLLFKNGKAVANAVFQFDEAGRLLSIKVQVF